MQDGIMTLKNANTAERDMSKHTIEIEGLPEGWEPVAYRFPVKDVDMILDRSGQVNNCTWNGETAYIIVQKTKPREITLVETDEDTEVDVEQTFPMSDTTFYVRSPKIWRIKED